MFFVISQSSVVTAAPLEGSLMPRQDASFQIATQYLGAVLLTFFLYTKQLHKCVTLFSVQTDPIDQLISQTSV